MSRPKYQIDCDAAAERRSLGARPQRLFGPVSAQEARAILDQAYSTEQGEGFDGILMKLLTGVIEPGEAIQDIQLECESIEERINDTTPDYRAGA